jgi:benzil reductase ((S)-benzoin forming)
VAQSLVFITGASSGLGLALARTVPWSPARVIDVSRRGAPGFEHVKADLADPTGWREVAALFERELAGFGGERAVFVHSAGTLDPIGFAGEVDAGAYARQVLLNSAAPQVLGDAFLRAARATAAPCFVVMISSGAARSVYEGWSAYGAGKAALDHWVRTAGAEQERRGGRVRILAVAPGVVETAMQEQIRATDAADFPEVRRFHELAERGELRAPEDAAHDVWSLLDRALPNGAVVDLRDVAAADEAAAADAQPSPPAPAKDYSRTLGVVEAITAVRDQCPSGAVQAAARGALEAIQREGASALPQQVFLVLSAARGWTGERAEQVKRSLRGFLEPGARKA